MSTPTEIQRFIQDISSPEYLLAASLGLIPGVSVEVKFGHNLDTSSGVRTDIWHYGDTQPVYVYPVDAGEGLTIVSDNIADTQTIAVEGTDGNGDFKTEVKSLNGITPVPLTGLWRSISRAGVEATTEVIGQVTVQGDGGVSTNVFALIGLEAQQTAQTPYLVPRGKLAVVINYSTAINKSAGVSVSVTFEFRVAKPGKVFRTKIRYGLEQDGVSNISSDLVVPVFAGPLSKFKISAIASASSTDISGECSMLLIDEGLVPAELLASLA